MNVLNQTLADFDPDVAALIGEELHRQRTGLEMIASENYAPARGHAGAGSVLTNKYAEGYPGRRYYGGCEHIDVIEQLAIDRVKALFGAEFANVQPHSGAQANAAVMHALLNPGDTILGLSLDYGGHLTHGMRLNFSGKLYNVAAYGVSKRGLPHRHGCRRRGGPRAPATADHCRLVGVPAPSRLRPVPGDRRRGRRLADGRHGALRRTGRRRAAPVAGAARPRRDLHDPQDPGRPRGGVILTNDADIAKKINSAVFPGQQGGPLEHVIAAKAVAFKMAAQPEFAERQQRCLAARGSWPIG